MTNPPTESPRHLGRYELVHPLGQGGMGEVYLAKISGAAGFEKPCIVKTILPGLLKDSQFLDRFHHEAKVLVHLVHSSIAQVYDMGEADGTYFMALEYVAGVDVAYLAEQARLQGQHIPVPVALYIGQKVAEGLGYAHRKTGPDGAPLGIVHRDVSPHNVMLSYEGEVKVIDFGLAKSAARSKYTLPSTVMGKLGYMSPEQARAEPLDHRSDIYSCGVMIWELIAGRPLIGHGTVGEMMAAMARPHVPALHELRPEVDPAVDAVVRRALAANPQERYGRSDELARALNEQLLRSSASIGAEEVGNYVKGLCPEAFSTQRKLISRISGVRRAPSTPPTGGVMPTSGVASSPLGAPPITGMEATSMRPLSEVDADRDVVYRPMATPLPGKPVSGAAPLVAGALVPRAAQSGPVVAAESLSAPPPADPAPRAMAPASGITKTRLAVAGLVLLLVMIGVAATTVYLMRGQGNPTPPAVAERTGEPPREAQGPVAEQPASSPGPTATPPSEAGPAAVAGPPGTAAAAPPPGTAAAAPTPAAPGSPEVTPTVAKAPEVAPVPAAPPSTVTKAPPTRPKAKPAVFLVVKDPVQIRERAGRFFVPAGKKMGLTADMSLKVVGGMEQNGKRKVLGSAVVQELIAGRAVLSFDEAAAKARGDRFVVLPKELAGESTDTDTEAEAETPPPAPAPPPPAPTSALRLGVRRTSMLGLTSLDGTFVIYNAESKVLSKCTATITRRQQHVIAHLRRQKNEFKQSLFRFNADAPAVPEGRMLIECEEGRAEVQIQ